jgi:predicted ATP-grasp superfamily ATP-dependent carboligase
VLIPDGESEHALWVVRSLAASKHVKIYILSNQRWTPVRFSRHCCRYEFRPTGTDHKARLEALADIAQQVHIDVILPVSVEGMLFAAMECEALSKLAALPPLPGVEALNTAGDKWLLNQFAGPLGVPVPEAVLVTSDPALEQRLSTLEYPVLLKPTMLSDGLRRFLESQGERLFNGNYLVQTYVPGDDVGLSVLCRDGAILAFTMQRGIISEAHRFGPLMAMEFIYDEDVLETGRRLFSALRWNGVAHVDFRYDRRDGRAKIVEVNPRYWGSLLGSLVAGVNFPYLACLAAQRIPFSRPAYRLSKYAHSSTAIKQALLWLFKKNALTGFTFQETGLNFFWSDPIPEVVKRLQELG